MAGDFCNAIMGFLAELCTFSTPNRCCNKCSIIIAVCACIDLSCVLRYKAVWQRKGWRPRGSENYVGTFEPAWWISAESRHKGFTHKVICILLAVGFGSYTLCSIKNWPPRYQAIKMSNLNKFEYSFVRLIHDKFLKRLPNFVEKYYFLPKLLIVEYR